jgi:hypothetical protein
LQTSSTWHRWLPISRLPRPTRLTRRHPLSCKSSRAILQNSSLIQPTLTGGSVGYVVVFQARIVDLQNGVLMAWRTLHFFLSAPSCPTRTYTALSAVAVLFTCRGLKSCFELVGARWNQLNPGDLSPRFVEVTDSMPGRRTPLSHPGSPKKMIFIKLNSLNSSKLNYSQ